MKSLKKLLTPILTLSFFLGTSLANAGNIAVRFTNVSDGEGNRSYKNDNYGGVSCPPGGASCIVTVISDDECNPGGICEDVLPPALLVHVQVPGMIATNTFDNTTVSISTSNFQFTEGEYLLTICDYPERPWYNGISVNLAGKSTDGSGYLHISFPWITQ